MAAETLTIGPFVVGEKPTAIDYQFTNQSDGTPLDLTGYVARFIYRERDGVAFEVNANVSNPAQGTVTYTWTGNEIPAPGSYLAEFWVGNGAQRYASWKIVWTARAPVDHVPNI